MMPVATLGVVLWAQLALAQTATVIRNANLRPDPSTSQAPIRLVQAGEELTVLSAAPESGYHRVRTADGQEGWVLARNIGMPRGGPSQAGCGDGLWQHVYNPARLIVKQPCVTVTGVIVDATANQSTHQPDGVRHEPDGDTHGWLKVDPAFQNLIGAGNVSNEGGNLVFEIVCHYRVTQADAKSACIGFKDATKIPAVGTHVAIKGSFVQDTIHNWNEIHPVSTIKAQ